MKRFLSAVLCVATLAVCSTASAQQSGPATAAQSQHAPNASERPRLMLVRVWVTDLERSERFYRTVFGFAAAQAFGSDNRIFGPPSPTMPSIVLARVDQPRGNGSFALAVNDAAAVMSAVEAAGGAIERPTQQAHGMPIGFITDPDGTVIEVIQLPPSTHQ